MGSLIPLTKMEKLGYAPSTKRKHLVHALEKYQKGRHLPPLPVGGFLKERTIKG
jgi:hypothetical protein